MDPAVLLLLGLQLGGLVLAALTARLAMRAWKISRSPPLLRFAAGFLALGLAQAAASVLELAGATSGRIETRHFDAFDALFWSYYAFLLVGFLGAASSFDRAPFRWLPAQGPALLLAGPLLQIVALALAFFAVLHAGLNHIQRAHGGSFRTATGFFLLFVGQGLFLLGYEPLTPRNLLGEVVTLAGFALLWHAAAHPGGGR